MGLGDQGHADGGRRENDAQDDRVEHDDPEIAGPAPRATDALSAPRRQDLPRRHGGKNAGEGTKTDERLMREEGGKHGPIYGMRREE